MQRADVQNTLDRILAVSWKYDLLCQGSHIALIEEYFRRMILWLKALNRPRKLLLVDLSEMVNPDILVSREPIRMLDAHLAGHDPLFKETMIHVLLWAAVKDSPEAKQANLPDPYEPLVLMYERGGTFWCPFLRRDGILILSDYHHAYPMILPDFLLYERELPFVDLDTASLNTQDITYLTEQKLHHPSFTEEADRRIAMLKERYGI